jgi:hypothetical protein
MRSTLRSSSPASYGVTRAMGVAEALERRRTAVAGVILISNGIQAGQVIPPAISSALFVPRFTATALYHKKLAADLQANQQDAMSKSETWARTVYAPALARRDSLSAAERAAIIEQLRRFTGADSRWSIRKRSLSLQRRIRIVYSRPKHRARALRHTNVDAAQRRHVGLATHDGSEPAPGARSHARYLGAIDSVFAQRVDSRATSCIKVRSRGYRVRPRSAATGCRRNGARQYDSSTAGGRGGGRGRGGATGTPAAPLQVAMTLDSKLRVLVLGGLYDTVVPTCQSIDEAIARIDATIRPRVSARCYSGGHMMYTDKTVRAEMKRDVAAFIRGKGR